MDSISHLSQTTFILNIAPFLCYWVVSSCTCPCHWSVQIVKNINATSTILIILDVVFITSDFFILSSLAIYYYYIIRFVFHSAIKLHPVLFSTLICLLFLYSLTTSPRIDIYFESACTVPMPLRIITSPLPEYDRIWPQVTSGEVAHSRRTISKSVAADRYTGRVWVQITIECRITCMITSC